MSVSSIFTLEISWKLESPEAFVRYVGKGAPKKLEMLPHPDGHWKLTATCDECCNGNVRNSSYKRDDGGRGSGSSRSCRCRKNGSRRRPPAASCTHENKMSMLSFATSM